jgi:sulfide:quinone oxidoreductase
VEDGWIPVDHTTFATRFPNVYAVGDVTSAPVPRAGGIVEGEASTVAKFVPPDVSMVNDKKQWGAERRSRWFGHDITT